MEVQSECVEPPAAPPCDSQPSGKINKAAFKLFGKRRSGAGMVGFFSFRNKGAANGNGNSENGSSANGNSDNGSSANGSSANGNSVVDLVRSRTHDGLTSERGGEETGGQEAGPVRSLSKSLSFFSLLRRGSARASESSGSGFGRRGRGLKGLFSSFRWRRKDRAIEGGVEVAEGRDGDAVIPEELKDVTLTLEPQPHPLQEDPRSPEAEPGSRGTEASDDADAAAATPTHRVAVSATPSDSPYTPVASPLRAPPALSKAKASVPSVTATPTLERCGGGGGAGADPPSEPSVDRLCSLLFTDVTSLKSFDSLTGCGDIIADAEEEGGANGGSGSSSSSSGGGGEGGGGGGGGGRTGILAAVRGPPAKPPASPPRRHPSLPVTAAAPLAPLPARARAAPPPPQQPSGSGVVAYMGGGEEMASPDAVDDADMQGLWHMLPSTGDDSPALARPHPHPNAGSTHPPRSAPVPPNLHSAAAYRSADRKPPQVKALGLSKIPVVGGGGVRAGKPPLPHARHHPTSPHEKELLSDEGYWDTPTATPTATPDDGGLQRSQRIGLSPDSCSGDLLYDLYDDPEEDAERSEEEEEEGEEEEEDLTTSPSPPTGDCKLSPPSQASPPTSSSSSLFRSMKGSASLPRESKIPVSLKQTTPPHSASQSALSSVLEVEPPPPKTQAPPPARTRIPVSKVPVRRSGNKPGNATRGSTHRK